MALPHGGPLALPIGKSVDALARAWRRTGSDEVARRLVTLSEAYADFFSPLPKRGPAFEENAKLGLDRMLSVLLRAVTRGSDGAAAERLHAIHRVWPDDPRVAPYLERWRRAAAYPRGTQFRTALERVAPSLSERAKLPLSAQEQSILGEADDLVASLPKRRTALALLRDVYAHPEDLARRLVLSDALIELGEPWGELIALQCARRDRPAATKALELRELTLLAEGRTAWLGRLAEHVVEPERVIFEDGFPAALPATFTPRAVGLYEWSTIRSLQNGQRYPYGSLQTLSLLARVPLVRHAEVLLVATGGRRPRLRTASNVEHLAVRIIAEGAEPICATVRALAGVHAPALRRLDLQWLQNAPAAFAAAFALLETRFGRSLKELRFDATLPRILDHAAERIAAGEVLPILGSLPAGSIEVDAAKRALVIEVARPTDMRSLADAIRRARVTRVRIEAVSGVWKAVNDHAWQAELQGRTKVEVVRA